jgi:hypothetical protein
MTGALDAADRIPRMTAALTVTGVTVVRSAA